MITNEDLRRLMGLAESDVLDFKAEQYRLGDDHHDSLFIKDLLAMANTPRAGDAYIVLGVKLHIDGTREFKGITDHLDDADLQDKLNRAGVQPRPKFVYHAIRLSGLTFGVIEIPLSPGGPFRATKRLGVLLDRHVYLRRGTKNEDATDAEERDVRHWFSLLDTPVDLPEPTPRLGAEGWDELCVACHHFRDDGRLYAFVIGPPEGENLPRWDCLGRLPASLVLDFDPDTEAQGAYRSAGPVLKQTRSVHLWTHANPTGVMVPDRGCYWFAARGLSGLASSLAGADWRSWNRMYGAQLDALLRNYAKAAGEQPVTLVCLWHAPEYLREVCVSFDRVFGERAEYVYASPRVDLLEPLAQQFGGRSVAIDVSEVLHRCGLTFPEPGTGDANVAGIPTAAGETYLVLRDYLNWLLEDMDVLHSTVQLEPSCGTQVGYDFLRGGAATWADLDQHYDADRDRLRDIREVVLRELESRNTTRVNLYHWPGGGGTTLARRVSWEVRERFPVVVLRRVVPAETVARFRALFQWSGSPILAVAEGATAAPDDLEHLYTELKADNIPVVFLSVLRRFGLPDRSRHDGSERVVFLGADLSVPESVRFCEAYKRVVPSRAAELDALLANRVGGRTPFHYALTAFGRNFTGLPRYVRSRIAVATASQRDILVFLAMAHYYGHKSVDVQIFAPHLGQPQNRTLRLSSVLGEPQLELVLQEDARRWRPSHHLISEAILKEVLSGDAQDTRVWKKGLLPWALAFLDVCSKGVVVPSDELMDLVRRMYILRDEHDLLGTERSAAYQFSRLIEDMESDEGRLTILKELVDRFPGEAHFWGHLGRFCSIALGNFTEAIRALNQALYLSPNDPVLYHMKGMCHRNLVYARLDKVQEDSIDLPSLQAMVGEALDAFARARELDPESEHSNISAVQLLIRLLDSGFRWSRQESRSAFLTAPSSGWYRELLDEAEHLMDRVRGARQGETPSRYEVDCQAKLDIVYDDYSRAIQGWINLLARQDTYAPPVRRQVVRTYLARRGRQWAELPPREVDRVLELMEANLREEPTSEQNIRLWFRALRYSSRQNLDYALDRLVTWRTMEDSVDAYFYLYILHALAAIDGSTEAAIRGADLIEQCRARTRRLRYRTRSFEWLGNGEGLRRLVHHTELGEWSPELDFFENTSRLSVVHGRIRDISRPEAGTIEIESCGLSAFFVPGRSKVERGRDENLQVTCYLGFSYDGPRAWSVQRFSEE